MTDLSDDLKEILREVKVKDSSTYFDTFFLVLARFPAYKNVLCKTMFYNKNYFANFPF